MNIKLNAKEERVLKALVTKSPQTLAELSKLWRDPQAGSWARNSVRKLVRETLVRKIGRGTYQVLAKGRRRAAETGKVNNKPKRPKSNRRVATPKPATVKMYIPPRAPRKRSIAERILVSIQDDGPQSDSELASRLKVPQPSIRRARKQLGVTIAAAQPGVGAGHQTKWGWQRADD